MKIKKCKHNKEGFFEGPFIISPEIYSDNRGCFFESWNLRQFNNLIKKNNIFVQDNQSTSHKGVLRGMHYQIPPMDQGKLVRCTHGSVYDVIVDLRLNSDTFSLWSGIKLNANNNSQLWIPSGFAHGFLSLEQDTIFEYKVTNYWSKNHEKTLCWDDRTININWPEIGIYNISYKDNEGLSLEKLKSYNYLF